MTRRVREEDGDAPLTDEAWPEPSEESFFSGKVTGGVDKHRGRVLLPERRWAEQSLIVGASSGEPISDSKAFAALITDAARAVAAGAACGDLPEEPGTLLPPSSGRPARLPTGGCAVLTGSPSVARCRRTPKGSKRARGRPPICGRAGCPWKRTHVARSVRTAS